MFLATRTQLFTALTFTVWYINKWLYVEMHSENTHSLWINSTAKNVGRIHSFRWSIQYCHADGTSPAGGSTFPHVPSHEALSTSVKLSKNNTKKTNRVRRWGLQHGPSLRAPAGRQHFNQCQKKGSAICLKDLHTNCNTLPPTYHPHTHTHTTPHSRIQLISLRSSKNATSHCVS